MANFFEQKLRIVSERENSIDSIGAAYAPPTSGTTTVVDDSVAVSIDNAVVQQFPIGFGSYLDGILPPDIATAAGAFSVSMQQVKNISSIPIEKFAQIVTNLETINGLPINGTTVPVDTTLVNDSLPLIALGSGPYGTYTMSDFFGCMTGVPYVGIDILGLINALETPTLYNIYKQLYLAVTWQRATASVQYTGPDGLGNYTISGITITDSGGGYGREGAPTPTVSCNWASATASIGTDDKNITSFGRVTSINGLTFPATSSSVPTLTIDFPPGIGSFSNTIVQSYIDAANSEIRVIQSNNQQLSDQLNDNWNATGTQLTIEQRAINTGLTVPVPPAPADVVTDLAQFPTTQYAFTDSIPQFALNTDPHMQAQSLEAIANICSPGGQSMVGMMRESRNQARLTQVGISLDNNISDSIPAVENKTLLANGSINNSPPAKLSQVDCNTGNEVTANPYGFYNPENNNYYITNPAYLGAGGVGLGNGNAGGGTSVAGGNNSTGSGWTGDGQIGGGSTPANPTPVDVGNAPTYGLSSLLGNSQTLGTVGPSAESESLAGSTAVPAGRAASLGSFAGSPYTNVIPANLNVLYTSNNLLPSTYTIPEAIDEVIRCNCDCWDMI
jgi:hypothetical protein